MTGDSHAGFRIAPPRWFDDVDGYVWVFCGAITHSGGLNAVGQFIAAQADKDPELELAVVQAYNDWHVQDWAGAYSTASYRVQFHRCGIRRRWPLRSAGCLGQHVGSGAVGVQTLPDAPVSARIACIGLDIYPTGADLVWSPLFECHPDLKDALAEGGIGWMPYFLERADFTYRHHKKWTRQDLGGRLPSEVFQEHIVTCFIDDAFGLANLAYLKSRDGGLGVRLLALGQHVAGPAAKVRRTAPRGVRSIVFYERPHVQGWPSLFDPNRFWDPLFRTAEELGIVLSCHIGSSSTTRTPTRSGRMFARSSTPNSPTSARRTSTRCV